MAGYGRTVAAVWLADTRLNGTVLASHLFNSCHTSVQFTATPGSISKRPYVTYVRIMYAVCFYPVPRSWTPGQLFLNLFDIQGESMSAFVQVAPFKSTFPYGLISVCDLFLQIQDRPSSSTGMPAHKKADIEAIEGRYG